MGLLFVGGLVHLGYTPNPESRVIAGLSKLSRVVELYSQRFQLQERMPHQIAQVIMHALRRGLLTIPPAGSQ